MKSDIPDGVSMTLEHSEIVVNCLPYPPRRKIRQCTLSMSREESDTSFCIRIIKRGVRQLPYTQIAVLACRKDLVLGRNRLQSLPRLSKVKKSLVYL